MVKVGIVIGHKILEKGIKVDKANIEVIEKLPPPSFLKGIQIFLGHVAFYCRFINDLKYKPLLQVTREGVEVFWMIRV